MDSQTPEQKKFTLLLVDDDYYMLQNLAKLFRKTPIEIITAIDGKDAYQKYLEYSPDIIVTDVYMPKMDGPALIDKIRLIDEDVIIIAMSADPNAKKQLENCDIQQFFQKLGILNLVTAIQRLISIMDTNTQNTVIQQIKNSIEEFEANSCVVGSIDMDKLIETMNIIKSPTFLTATNYKLDEIEKQLIKHGIHNAGKR